jgi:predicted HTH domain antitoxin
MKPIHLDLEINPDLLISLNKTEKEFSKEIKTWAAISLYQFNKLSLARAANLAGYHRYDFEKLLSDLEIPISQLDINDIKKDLDFLGNI